MLLSAGARCRILLCITALAGIVGFWLSHRSNSFALWGDTAHLIGDGLPFVGILLLIYGTQVEEQIETIEWLIRWLNRIFLTYSGIYLLGGGLYRLWHPEIVEPSVVLGASIELGANIAQAFLAHTLRDVYHRHDTHRSQMAHLLWDIATSVAVLLGAIAIALTGISAIDAYMSVVLGPLVVLALRHIEGHNHSHEHHHAHGHKHYTHHGRVH